MTSDNNLIRKPTVLLFDGPDLTEGETPCVVCLMLWKTEALNYYVEQKLLAKHPVTGAIDIDPKVIGNEQDGEVLRLPLEVGQDRWRPAGCRGMAGMLPMAGVIDVCWTHLSGIGFMPVSRLAVGQPGMPGMG